MKTSPLQHPAPQPCTGRTGPAPWRPVLLRPAAWTSLLAAWLAATAGQANLLAGQAALTSPGLAPSQIDDQGRLVEDWGALAVELSGEGLSAPDPPVVESNRLDEIVPAAQARTVYGPVTLSLTAFRAPAWPNGLDVLTARVEDTAGQERTVQLSLRLPENTRLGSRMVTAGNRVVLSLPEGTKASQQTRDWGWDDDAVSLPGWAKPAVECDPGFGSIRAGLHGVPICYTFQVERKAACHVVLGFCESHWAEPANRPVVCQVEGAPLQEIDPVARWGQHQPGVLLFEAKDENGDGKLEVSVLPKLGAPDQNPILNVLWVFPAAEDLNLDQVLKGRLNAVARHYVDAGGEKDQGLQAGGRVAYTLKIPAKGARELSFFVAAKGGSVPLPDKTAWTVAKLRRAAVEVWKDWPKSL